MIIISWLLFALFVLPFIIGALALFVFLWLLLVTMGIGLFGVDLWPYTITQGN